MIKQLGYFQKPIPYETPHFIAEASIAGINTKQLNKYINQSLISENLDTKALFYSLLELFTFVSTTLSIFLLGYFYKKSMLSNRLKALFLTCFSGYLLNSLVIGLLTDPNPRYNFRLAWVFPFCMVLVLTSYFFASKDKTH